MVQPSHFEATENYPPVIINIRGNNIAIHMAGHLMSGQNQYTQLQVSVETPDLMINYTPGPNFGRSQIDSDTRRTLIRETLEYITHQLGDQQYKYAYDFNGSGIMITKKSREHEEAQLADRAALSTGIDALDRVCFSDSPLDGAKEISEQIRRKFAQVKSSPDLLGSDEVPAELVDKARNILQSDDTFFDHVRRSEVNHNGSDIIVPEKYEAEIFIANPDELESTAKGLKRFFVDHDLDIGLRFRRDSFGFHLEASPEANERLKQVLAEKREMPDGALRYPPATMLGSDLPSEERGKDD